MKMLHKTMTPPLWIFRFFKNALFHMEDEEKRKREWEMASLSTCTFPLIFSFFFVLLCVHGVYFQRGFDILTLPSALFYVKRQVIYNSWESFCFSCAVFCEKQ
jgi:hypothetical protein